MEKATNPQTLHSEVEDVVEVGTSSLKPTEEKNKKRHLNMVLIGHVDAGKSTIGGRILHLSGQVDKRTINKYEKEARDNSRESWYMAYIMDTNEEERVKGITIEVGRAHFETETTRFTILDAPGHKSYVPNMISGASQADIGVLVISAREGEFETGFEKGGQTGEHVQLAKTLGVSKLVVVVNKMDDRTVNWSKERYDRIQSKMVPFLGLSGYKVKKDIQFLPISGLQGANIQTRLDKNVCPWWQGPCLLEALNSIEVPPRDPDGPFRMPIIDKFKDMGTVVMGKVESGTVREGDNLLIMPNKVHVKVIAIYCDEDKVRSSGPGENLRVRLSGIEEEDILSGFVLSSIAYTILNMAKIAIGSIGEITKPDCIQALVVEFIVTFLFIFAGVGSAMATEKLAGNEVVGLLFVALAHTFVVAVTISAGFRISGGHLNPSVTIGLLAGGHITVVRSIFYWIDQLLASVAACALLSYLTGGLTTPVHTLAIGMDSLQGVIMEIVLTFSLVFTVYATLVDPKKGFLEGLGPLLTGLVVGANIMAGGPFSGASMNPARSFGPALVAGDWTDHWVYWVGPLIGGGLAGFIYENFFIVKTYVPLATDEEAY